MPQSAEAKVAPKSELLSLLIGLLILLISAGPVVYSIEAGAVVSVPVGLLYLAVARFVRLDANARPLRLVAAGLGLICLVGALVHAVIS